MTKNGIINIHGKDYMTVAKRLELWHEETKASNSEKSIRTEVLQHTPVVVIKAVVRYGEKEFTGISSANPDKVIEKENPYEVAETSAVGRALGFAGYGATEYIASADEMQKAMPFENTANTGEEVKVCSQHDNPIEMRQGISNSTGKKYWYHRSEDGKQICFGTGWK